MIQCPKCGAEYTTTPDVCEQCQTPLTQTDELPDPFAAALLQEQRSREQQQKVREAFLNHRNEKSAAAQTAAVPPSEQTPQHGTKKKRKRREAMLWISFFAIVGLFVLAFFTLRGGILQKKSQTGSYAFYRKDDSLWFYQDDIGKQKLLTSNFQPQHAKGGTLSDDYLEKLTQISTDGSRVYYPLNFTEERCQIACRQLSEPDKESILFEIPLHLNVNTELNSNDYYTSPLKVMMSESNENWYTDMMPPYIIQGDTVFFINPDHSLCRKTAEQDAEVLAENVVRYWQISGKEGVFYLTSSVPLASPEAWIVPTGFVNTRLTSWGISETTSEPCYLHYYPPSGESEQLYPLQELSIQGWAVPYTDSDRYFYFWCEVPETGGVVFYQVDLLRDGFIDMIETGVDEVVPLCAYPDGSLYYAIRDSVTSSAFLCYFNRKQAQSHKVFGFGMSRDEPTAMLTICLDICRTEPYVLEKINMDTPMLYYCEKPVGLSTPLPAEYPPSSSPEIQHINSLRFDEHDPILYLYSARMDLSGYLSSSSVETAIELSEITLEYAMLNKENPVTFLRSPFQSELNNEAYSAKYVPDAAEPDQWLLFFALSSGYEPPSKQEHRVYDAIMRKDDSLFLHSVLENAIYGYRDQHLQKLSAENSIVYRYNWKPISADAFFAIDATKTLTLYLPHSSITIDTADMLFSVGQMPETSADK